MFKGHDVLNYTTAKAKNLTMPILSKTIWVTQSRYRPGVAQRVPGS